MFGDETIPLAPYLFIYSVRSAIPHIYISIAWLTILLMKYEDRKQEKVKRELHYLTILGFMFLQNKSFPGHTDITEYNETREFIPVSLEDTGYLLAAAAMLGTG
ncbi:hypothetical protein ACJX0J_013890 [Zea mays]